MSSFPRTISRCEESSTLMFSLFKMRVDSHHVPQLGAVESLADVLLQLLTEHVDLGKENQGVEPSHVCLLPHFLDLCLQSVIHHTEIYRINGNANTVDLVILARLLVISFNSRSQVRRQLK